jgi:hypothetical protein
MNATMRISLNWLPPDTLLQGQGKCIRGKKLSLTAPELHALRDEDACTVAPARALAAEALTVRHTLSELVNQAYALPPAEIALMWQTAPLRMPISPKGSAPIGWPIQYDPFLE